MFFALEDVWCAGGSTSVTDTNVLRLLFETGCRYFWVLFWRKAREFEDGFCFDVFLSVNAVHFTVPCEVWLCSLTTWLWFLFQYLGPSLVPYRELHNILCAGQQLIADMLSCLSRNRT